MFIPNLDIVVSLIIGVVIIPIILVLTDVYLGLIKYYPVVLLLLVKYLTLSKHTVLNEIKLFDDLYLTTPKTNIQIFSSVVINLFAAILILFISLKSNMNASPGEKFGYGILFYILLHSFTYFYIFYIIKNIKKKYYYK